MKTGLHIPKYLENFARPHFEYACTSRWYFRTVSKSDMEILVPLFCLTGGTASESTPRRSAQGQANRNSLLSATCRITCLLSLQRDDSSTEQLRRLICRTGGLGAGRCMRNGGEASVWARTPLNDN
jgi:hypothetical protein